MAISKDHPPLAYLQRARELFGALSERGEVASKLLEHLKSIHGITIAIFVVLAGIGKVLGVPVPWPGEGEHAEPAYEMPFHVPGTVYDGKNDPIVSTPRFAEQSRGMPKAPSHKVAHKVNAETQTGLVAAIDAFFAKLFGSPADTSTTSPKQPPAA